MPLEINVLVVLLEKLVIPDSLPSVTTELIMELLLVMGKMYLKMMEETEGEEGEVTKPNPKKLKLKEETEEVTPNLKNPKKKTPTDPSVFKTSKILMVLLLMLL